MQMAVCTFLTTLTSGCQVSMRLYCCARSPPSASWRRELWLAQLLHVICSQTPRNRLPTLRNLSIRLSALRATAFYALV